MAMKKKLLASVLAGALAFGGFAWAPVGGSAVKTASAASAPQVQEAMTELINPIWNKLDSTERGQVEDWLEALEAAWNELDNPAYSGDYLAIIDPLYEVLKEATDNFTEDDYQFIKHKRILAKLMLYWAVGGYDAQGEFLDKWRTEAEVRGAARELAVLGGVSPSAVNFAELQETVEALQQAAAQVVSSDELVDIVLENLLNGGVAVARAVASAVFDKLQENDDLVFVEIMENVETKVGAGELKQALVDSFVALMQEIPETKEAVVNLGAAAIRANVTLANASTSASTLQLQLRVFGQNLSNRLIFWSEDSNVLSINDAGLATFSGSATSTIPVKASILTPIGSKEIFTGNITFNVTSTPPSGGDTPAPPAPPAPPATVPGQGDVKRSEQASETLEQVQDRLNNLKEQVNNAASEEEKKQLVNEAKQSIRESIKELTKLDATEVVQVSGGKATTTLNVNTVVAYVRAIKQELEQLNAALKQIDPNAQEEKLTIQISLGTVNAQTTEVPLANELLTALANEGVEALEVEMNGVALSLPTSELSGDTTLTVTEEEGTAAQETTNLPIRSKVYNFNLNVGGQAKSRFSNAVRIAIPVDANDVDPDYLVLAQIVDGELVFHGGAVVNGVLIAERRTFSTYVVVENRVTFDDIASVESWAGSAISTAAAKGIVQGRGGGVFDPQGEVTRAEFAKMITKAFFLEDGTLTETFTDVNASDWFQTYVAVAAKHGIVNGRTVTKFAPHDKITREELATMVARALTNIWGTAPAADVEGALSVFTDSSSIDAVHRAGVALVVSEGLMIGNNGKFNPDGYATRAEAAVIIKRILDAYAARQ
jgi:hypothetical protein